MTLLEMYDELEARLQPYDTNRDWTPVQLVVLLNRAQRIAVGKLHPFTTPELVLSQSTLAITSGYYTLTDLTIDSFRGEAGVIAVQLSNGYYCTLISEEERRANDESSFVYQSTDPKMWFEGNKLYIRPYSGYTIAIRYRGEPTLMALGSPSNTDSALTDDVQDITLEIAEARALRALDKRASMLTMATAEDMIQELNSAYAPVQAVRLEVTDLLHRNY